MAPGIALLFSWFQFIRRREFAESLSALQILWSIYAAVDDRMGRSCASGDFTPHSCSENFSLNLATMFVLQVAPPISLLLPGRNRYFLHTWRSHHILRPHISCRFSVLFSPSHHIPPLTKIYQPAFTYFHLAAHLLLKPDYTRQGSAHHVFGGAKDCQTKHHPRRIICCGPLQ